MVGFLDTYGVQPTQGPSANTDYGQTSLAPNSILAGFNGYNGLQGGTASGQPQSMLSKIGGVLGSKGFASGMGAFSTLADMYTGFRSLGLAKDQLNFQKRSFNKNFNASAKAYENQLKDRWEARSNAAASRGQTYQSMSQWVGDRRIQDTGGNTNTVPGRTNIPDSTFSEVNPRQRQRAGG